MKNAQEIKDEIWPNHKGSTAWIDKERIAVIQKVIEWADGSLEKMKVFVEPANVRMSDGGRETLK